MPTVTEASVCVVMRHGHHQSIPGRPGYCRPSRLLYWTCGCGGEGEIVTPGFPPYPPARDRFRSVIRSFSPASGSYFVSSCLLPVIPAASVVYYPAPFVLLSLKVAGAPTMPARNPSVVSSFHCRGLALRKLPGRCVTDPEARSGYYMLPPNRGPHWGPRWMSSCAQIVVVVLFLTLLPRRQKERAASLVPRGHGELSCRWRR
jgi:hypothetical protein